MRSPPVTSVQVRLLRALALVVLPLVVGCEGSTVEPAPPPITDGRQLYTRLRLDHHAVALTTPTTPPYDTLTIVATPENAMGEPLATDVAPTYAATAAELVQVSPEGVLQAVAPGVQVVVVATLTIEGVTRSDTVLVDVVDTPTPPVLTTLSARPVPPDSAKMASSFLGAPLPVRMLDADGNPLSLPAYFSSSDPSIATIDRSTGMITPWRPGPVAFYVSATAFGIQKADTVPYRIGLSLVRAVTLLGGPLVPGGPPKPRFEPVSIRIGIGGAIVWQNESGAEVELLLADPAAAVAPNPLAVGGGGLLITVTCDVPGANCAGGQIGMIPNVTAAVRAFPMPGTYEYHSPSLGISGRVVVVDEN